MTTLVWEGDAPCPRCGIKLGIHFEGICPDGKQPADQSAYVPPIAPKGPFANHPVTIGEVRAMNASDSSAWSPRDALIQLLREIDNGLEVRAMVVTMSVSLDDGGLGHSFRNACPDNFTALGLLARAGHRLQEL